jgi:DNA-directed RNA polymerase
MSQDNTAVNLMQVQVALEESMRGRGEERYQRLVNSAVSRKSEDTTGYGQKIASTYTAELALAYDAFKADAASGRAGKRHSSIKLIGDRLTSKEVAFITLKTVLGGISGVRTLSRLAIQIGMNLEDEIRLAGIREQEKRVYASIVEGAMKRGSQHYKHIYAVRRAEYFNDGWKKWSDRERLIVGIKMVELTINTVGIIETARLGSDNKTRTMVYPTNDTLQWIEKFNISGFKAVLEPMVVQPRDWTSPFDGGYLTSNIRPLRLVKSKTRKRLAELYGEQQMPLVYQTVNSLQRTAWQINAPVLDVLKTLWETESELGGLPYRGEFQPPHKPHDIDTNQESRDEWRREAAKAYSKNLEAVSHRVSFSMTIDLASRYVDFKRIFMPYQLDFRGRIYAVPHLNPQGADFQKALLRFAEGKPLGAEGVKWLIIHGANVAGVDKVSFQDRVDWVEANEDEILAIAKDPLQNTGWSSSVGGIDIDKPWQFLAFCFEYAGYCEQGEKYVSRLPIALDGSCSGLQHFSAMLLDTEGGTAVNLLPQEKPADVYQLVADEVITQVLKDAENGTEDELLNAEGHIRPGTKPMAQQWLSFGITRKTTKRSVMTLAYGSKMYGFKDQIMEDTLRPAKKQMGDDFPFYGDGYPAASYMARKIWEAVQVKITSAPKAMAWLQEVVKVANQEGKEVIWSTPAGFKIEQSYIQMKELRVETSLNGTINLKITQATENLDARLQTQGIAPNFVHSMDSSHLMFTVCRANDAGIKSFAMIHDSFGTHAADTDALFATVRDCFVEMYQQNDVLGQFKEAVASRLQNEALLDRLPVRLVTGELDLEEVKYSMYCFA